MVGGYRYACLVSYHLGVDALTLSVVESQLLSDEQRQHPPIVGAGVCRNSSVDFMIRSPSSVDIEFVNPAAADNEQGLLNLDSIDCFPEVTLHLQDFGVLAGRYNKATLVHSKHVLLGVDAYWLQ